MRGTRRERSLVLGSDRAFLQKGYRARVIRIVDLMLAKSHVFDSDGCGSYGERMERWFYSHAGVRTGPVELPAVQAAADRGELVAADLVWHDGLADWTPAGQIAELKLPAIAPAVSYFSTGLPERAATNLRGYARPTGDTGAGPLADQELADFVLASKHRHSIRRAVAVFRFTSLLSAIVMLVVVLLMIFPMDPIPGMGSPELLGTLIDSVVGTLVCAYGAWATHRNQPWGPYAVAAALIITLLAQIGESIPSLFGSPETAVIAAVVDVVSALFTLGFLWTTYTAGRSIVRLRASPAWCQEALVAGKW